MSSGPRKASFKEYLQRKKQEEDDEKNKVSTLHTTSPEDLQQPPQPSTPAPVDTLPTPAATSWDDIESALSCSSLPPLLSPTLPPVFINGETQQPQPQPQPQVRDTHTTTDHSRSKHGTQPVIEIESPTPEDDPVQLPPPLSPSIPQVFLAQAANAKEKLEMPQMLSPTLPPQYSLISDGTLVKPKHPNTGSTAGAASWRDSEERKGSTSFEKVVHLGVHSYLFTRNQNEKKFLLTLHVPRWYKENPVEKTKAYKIKKTAVIPLEQKEVVGLGIKISKKRSHSPGIITEEKPKKKPTSKTTSKSSAQSETPNNSPPSVTGTSSSSSSSSSSESNKAALFISKYEQHLAIAKEKKHRGDALTKKDMKLAVITFMDCIITYLVSFHYEDQSLRINKRLYDVQSWIGLASLIDFVCKLCIDREFDDMAGLSLQIKGVVYEHIALNIGEHILLDQAKRGRSKDQTTIDSLTETIMKNCQNQIKYRQTSKRAFVASESYLSIFDLQEAYPKIVRRFRQQEPEEDSFTREKKGYGQLLDPMTQDFQLPVTSTVGIREITGYAIRVAKQWCRDEKINYTDWEFE